MKMRKLFPLLIVGFFFVFFMLTAGSSSSTTHTSSEEGQNLPEAVLRWKDKVTKEAIKNEISEAIPYLLGIIMAESGGNSEKYPDVMQYVLRAKESHQIQFKIQMNPLKLA